jgi:tryptophanyl-tRNA synthetase
MEDFYLYTSYNNLVFKKILMTDFKSKIETILREKNISYKIISLPDSIGPSVAEHMEFHGFGLDYATATILYKVNGVIIGIIKRSDTDIDVNKVKSFLKVDKVDYASQEDLDKLELKKGVIPLGAIDIKFYLDKKVLEKDFVYGGVGVGHASIKLNPKDIVKLNGAEVVDFTIGIEDIKFKRALSGITPSSTKGLHLGNYFGAVKPHVEFQSKGDCFYFIANMHALNTVFSGKEVEENTMNIFLEYLAFGIDPSKTTFYVQSDIDSIPYLQNVLNNVVTIAELKRMHGYKDKLQGDVQEDQINNGLFNYPVLMAADILIFNPDLIPVGEDQTQHVEITREIANSFNRRYGNILTIPRLFVKKDVARVKGIDGQRKMSKSLGNDIPIFGEENEVRKQIMKITTDPNRVHATDPGDPDKNVTFDYLELLDFDSARLFEMKEMYKSGTIKDVEIKEELFERFMDYFKDMRQKKQELEKNPDYLYELRAMGADKANMIAEKTLEQVKNAVGFKVPKFLPAQADKIQNSKFKVTYDDFAKLDIRIGTIVVAEKHPDADKLLRLEFDFGTEKRQIIAGIAEVYPDPMVLVGKQLPVIFNLEPRMMRGLESQGMIMATDDENGVVLLNPEKIVPSGSSVR